MFFYTHPPFMYFDSVGLSSHPPTGTDDRGGSDEEKTDEDEKGVNITMTQLFNDYNSTEGKLKSQAYNNIRKAIETCEDKNELELAFEACNDKQLLEYLKLELQYPEKFNDIIDSRIKTLSDCDSSSSSDISAGAGGGGGGDGAGIGGTGVGIDCGDGDVKSLSGS